MKKTISAIYKKSEISGSKFLFFEITYFYKKREKIHHYFAKNIDEIKSIYERKFPKRKYLFVEKGENSKIKKDEKKKNKWKSK